MMVSFNSTTFLFLIPLVTTASSLVPFLPVFLKGFHINRWMHTHFYPHGVRHVLFCHVVHDPATPILYTMSVHVVLSSFFNSCLVLDIKWMNHNLLNNTPDNGYLGLSPIFFFYYNTLWQQTPCTYLLAHIQYLHGTFFWKYIIFWCMLPYFLLRNLYNEHSHPI